jgi:hypothetical protein
MLPFETCWHRVARAEVHRQSLIKLWSSFDTNSSYVSSIEINDVPRCLLNEISTAMMLSVQGIREISRGTSAWEGQQYDLPPQGDPRRLGKLARRGEALRIKEDSPGCNFDRYLAYCSRGIWRIPESGRATRKGELPSREERDSRPTG